MSLSRRDAVQRLALLVGGTLSAPALSAVLSGFRAAPPPPGWRPQVLTPAQRALLDLLVDRIIPATDTPGAREAGVVAFIDTLLEDRAEPEERERFLRGLDAIEPESRERFGVPLAQATADQQQEFLARRDREAVQARRDGVRPLPFFATLKEWTLVGYYTSEIGATRELQWLAAPGRYDADLPLEEVGRTWA